MVDMPDDVTIEEACDFYREQRDYYREQRDYWRDLCHERSKMMGRVVSLLKRTIDPLEVFTEGAHPDDCREAQVDADDALYAIQKFLEGE